MPKRKQPSSSQEPIDLTGDETEEHTKSKKQKTTPVVEKRLAPLRSSIAAKLRARIDRALEERLFLISHHPIAEDPIQGEEFKVLGSTGNVYTVMITKLPTCNCPDFEKGNICKHLIFVFLKVLKVPPTSHYYYQKALLSSEVLEVLQFSTLWKAEDKSITASAKVVQTVQALEKGSASVSTDQLVVRKPINGEPCAICFDAMNEKEKIAFCRMCGNNLHDDCWQRWKKSSTHHDCVYCRTPNLGIVELKQNQEGYINLGNLQPGVKQDREYHYNPYSYNGRRKYYYDSDGGYEDDY